MWTGIRTVLTGIGVLLSAAGLMALYLLGEFPYRLSEAEAGNLKKTLVLAVGLLVMGLLSGFVVLAMQRRNPNAGPQIGGWASVVISSAGILMLWFDVGVWGVHSAPSSVNRCLNNQHLLDAAKAQWALRTDATNGSHVGWAEISGHFPDGFPQCPEGGEYELGRVGELATCSILEHRLAQP